ncbi:MAG: calcium-binding protein, partial [Prochlorococcus sp.]
MIQVIASTIVSGDGLFKEGSNLFITTNLLRTMAFIFNVLPNFFGNKNDVIVGSQGADFVIDWYGNNTISKSERSGRIYTGSGEDSIDAGDDNDIVFSGSGNNFVNADSGNHIIYAGLGGDSILAGDGDDTVYGGQSNDFINSGEGFDSIYGGEGNDRITAGLDSKVTNILQPKKKQPEVLNNPAEPAVKTTTSKRFGYSRSTDPLNPLSQRLTNN